MDRREFTGRALLAMLAGVTVSISGCENSAAPTEPLTDREGLVANNHGHVATITVAQQLSGGSVSLSIQGTSSHDHVIVLTAAEVESVKRGLQVVKDCDMNRNHVHAVSFNVPTAG